MMRTLAIWLAAGMLTAAPALAQTPKAPQNPGKVGPPLETVKAFGDDFRLVGIGVSAKGRVFATRAVLQCPLQVQHGRGQSKDRRDHALSRRRLE